MMSRHCKTKARRYRVVHVVATSILPKKRGDEMKQNFLKQFAIALALFLLGYWTFNGLIFN